MDYSQYHDDWRTVIRPAILERDRQCCRRCGIHNKIRVYKNSTNNYVVCDEFIEQWAVNNGYRVFTLALHVAHIDHDKSNNDPDNLISLCPKCHALFDSAQKKLAKITYKAQLQPKQLQDLSGGLTEYDQFLSAVRTAFKQTSGVAINKLEANNFITNLFQNFQNESK